MLFGHIAEFGLGAIQKALAGESSRAYSNFALVHVIALSLDVVFNAKGNHDTHLLVWLEHLIEGKIYGKQHANTHHGKADDGEQTAIIGDIKLPCHIHDGGKQHGEEIIVGIKFNAEIIEPIRHHSAQQVAQHHIPPGGARFGKPKQHSHHHEHKGQKHDEFAQSDVHKRHIGVFERQHKDERGKEACKEHQARHALAIKHEDKRKIHQRRAGFVLQNNDDDRCHNNGDCNHHISSGIERKPVGAKEFCQCQCGGKFGKFCRLQTHRS